MTLIRHIQCDGKVVCAGKLLWCLRCERAVERSEIDFGPSETDRKTMAAGG